MSKRRYYEYKGKSYYIAELAEKLGIKDSTLRRRLRIMNLTVDQAINYQSKYKKYRFKGKDRSLTEIARITGKKVSTLRYHVHDLGLSLSKALKRKKGAFKYKSKTYTGKQLEKVLNLSPAAIYYRQSNGIPLDAPKIKKEISVTYKGETKSIKKWAKDLKISENTLAYRLKKWPKEKAFNTKRMHGLRKPIFITHNGKTQTITQWAKELGFKKITLSRRYAKGARGNDLFKHLHQGIK